MVLEDIIVSLCTRRNTGVEAKRGTQRANCDIKQTLLGNTDNPSFVSILTLLRSISATSSVVPQARIVMLVHRVLPVLLIPKGIRSHRYLPKGVNILNYFQSVYLCDALLFHHTLTRPIYWYVLHWSYKLNLIIVFHSCYLLLLYSLRCALHCPKHSNP